MNWGPKRNYVMFWWLYCGKWAQPRGWVNAACCWWFRYVFHGNLWSLVLCKLSLRCNFTKSNNESQCSHQWIGTDSSQIKIELRGLAYEEFAARQCWRQFWSWSLSLWHVYARPRTCQYYIRFESNSLLFSSIELLIQIVLIQRCPLQDRQLRKMMLMMTMMPRLPCQWGVLG